MMNGAEDGGSVLYPGKMVGFMQAKYMRYVRQLGEGGTGSTHLFADDTTDLLFAVKKFEPMEGNDRADCYRRFVDEVKILLRLSHPNIVRVYTYYLYPAQLTGFIQMEYIDGVPIDQFKPTPSSKTWNELFADVVSAFCAMEERSVLHRDIRPNNILVDNSGEVKVIDFGFGKQYEGASTLEANSILLNWPADPPEEVGWRAYDHATEVYYLGKTLQGVLGGNMPARFDYWQVLEKMAKRKVAERYRSFAEVREAIAQARIAGDLFTADSKRVYQAFADKVVGAIAEFNGEPRFITEPQEVLQKLSAALSASMLEERIQDNRMVISCFVSSGFTCWTSSGVPIEVDTVRRFYSFFSRLPDDRQRIVLSNIAARMGMVKVDYSYDMPF